MSTGDKTREYREMVGLSQNGFGEALCKRLPGKQYDRRQVSQWETGQAQVPYDLALMVWIRYRDWRCDWALEVLKILKPHIWDVTVDNMSETDNMSPVTF